MTPADEREIREHFAERYRLAPVEVTRVIELAVIGGDWGANGYTTKEQADLLGRLLHLKRAVRLLDLGAGRGWPGLYLAASTGCDVVMTDVPLEGLVWARKRATHENLRRRATAAAASARALPFKACCFDAIVHTDVLCCLRQKMAVLRSCHRLLRPGARTAFYTIHPAPGLMETQRRRASRDGPICVAIRRPNAEMLASAGFVDVEVTDCTDEFARVTRSWLQHWDERRTELVSLLGEDSFMQRQADRRAQLRAIEDGHPLPFTVGGEA